MGFLALTAHRTKKSLISIESNSIIFLSSEYIRAPSAHKKYEENLYRNNRALCKAVLVRGNMLKSTFTGQHPEK